MSVPALTDPKYKAKSYGMFLTLLIIVSFLLFTSFVLIDHMRKSDEPLSDWFRKSREEYVTENERLRLQVDSLQVIASRVPSLEAALSSKSGDVVTSNIQKPNIGHFQDTKNLKNTNYQAYLTEKMKFYFNKSQRLEKYINENF